MSDRFPQYSLSQFPNSLDSYLIFQDVNISNKPLVDQYYSYINENDFASATQLIEDNPSLKYVIVTANTMQSIYDALMAIETTYSTDVIKTIATCVTSQGEWSSTGSYPIFSIVTSRGKAFMCIKPNCPVGTPVTDVNYWITMTMRGESGSSMSFHESYDSTFPYGIQDCVPFANRLYVSITNDNLGNQPDISPDFWSAVISVPTQTIISKNQPTGQDSNGLWYKTNDTNNSYEVNKSNGDNTYSPLFPTSKASYIKTSDGQTIDTALKSNSDLITEHKADTNNPHHTTPEQIGAVQGNTKAWVATEVSSSEVYVTKLTIPHFEFSEGCTITFKSVITPTDGEPVWANRIAIFDETGKQIGVYVLSTLSKEPVSSDAWAVGAMVTVTLSSEVVGTWSNLPTAFFKGGAPSVPSIFGTGADGDAVISGTVTLPVTAPHQSIVEKNYKSLIINAGAILKCASWNAGLILRVKGDCTIHGTIDQSGMAPKTNPHTNYPYPAQLVCGDGGNGGSGGSEYTSSGQAGVGMLKRPYGGGYSGGGSGGGAGSAYGDGGNGGDSTGTTIDIATIFVHGRPGQYGGGGDGPTGAGGNGAGANGANYGGGGAGNYGGGVVCLYVGGNLLIDGKILCNGLKGGNGGAGKDNSGGTVDFGGGGGAGGAGGGAIYILHRGAYTNSGLLQVNGGVAGTGGHDVNGKNSGQDGTAGGIGSITVIQGDK
ncbi:protein of unknown function [Ruminococcaceae bacterium BL-6]|nr:protein of unknown function [Ruminococcaceae bacterium BL-6]